MRERYVVARRAEKSRLLDEAVAMTGRHRKALIRRWGRPPRVRGCRDADAARVAACVALQQRLNPFALAQRIDQAVARVYQLANHRVRASVPPVDAARPMENAQSEPYRESRRAN